MFPSQQFMEPIFWSENYIKKRCSLITKQNLNRLTRYQCIDNVFILSRLNEQNAAIQSGRWLIWSTFYSRHLQWNGCVVQNRLRGKGYYITSGLSNPIIHSTLKKQGGSKTIVVISKIYFKYQIRHRWFFKKQF